MRRNVASQYVGAQMITAADGTAFTSTVTVYVTGDAGTQALGSVGSGVCTHEGNGFHTYAPAQAETNYTHVAFTFIGTGAVPATVQIYPTAYDASGRVDVGAVGGTAQTARDLGASVLLSSGTGTGQISLSSGLVTLAGVTHTGAVIPTVTTLTGHTAQTGDNYARLGAPAGASIAADIAAVKSDTAAILADTGTDGVVVNAAGLAADAVNEIADGILDRDMSTGTDSGSPTVRTVRQALRPLRNKWTASAGTYTVFKEDDTTTSWTSTLGSDAAADPIINSDPADA